MNTDSGPQPVPPYLCISCISLIDYMYSPGAKSLLYRGEETNTCASSSVVAE